MKTAKMFVNPLDTPFSRRNSYLALANANDGQPLFGKNTLYISNVKAGCLGMGNMGAQNKCRQVKVEMLHKGVKVPTVISTTPYELTLESDHGAAAFCIGEPAFIRCRVSGGVSLRLTPSSGLWTHHIKLDDGMWKIPFADDHAVIIPLKCKITPVGSNFVIDPDENGELEFGFEVFELDPAPRPIAEYPDYETCLTSVTEDFDSFCALYPSLPEAYEPMRLQALWHSWCMTVCPGEGVIYKHRMIKMVRFLFDAAFAWQQPMQAIWLSKDVDLAWELLASCFDFQDANGRIADSISSDSYVKAAMKPPVQGLALEWLMNNCDLSGIPMSEKKYVYDRMVLWTNWLFNFRDVDHDGVWENQSERETGWEDATYFRAGMPLICPDGNAYAAVMMDVLGKFGRTIGIDEAECAEWERRGAELVQKLIDKCWTGERWVAVNAVTGAKSDVLSLPLSLALVLGKRLPQDIIDKTVEHIFSAGYDTPHGLASESLDSPLFNHGFTQGSVIVPAQMLMCMALESVGRFDLAQKVGRSYANTLRDAGMFHIHNSLTGGSERGLVAFGEKQLFWSGWASSCYLYMAERYGK